MTFNSVRVFHECSAALDVLAKKEEPQEQESITVGDRLSLSLQGTEIGSRVCRIIQKTFSDSSSADISTKDVSLFLERWKSCVETSGKFSAKEKNKAVFRVLLNLFDEKNALSPFKVLEVLHGRSASSLSSVELRALERALSLVSFWHERFKKFLYMIGTKYVHTLWRMKLADARVEMKIVRGLSSIRVDWEKIPLHSPEAIDIASQFQAAEEKQNKEKLLQRMLPDLSSFNQESKEVLAICAIDFLWHFSWDICKVLMNRMPPIPAQEGVININLLHPFIAKGVRVLYEFTFLFESIIRSDGVEKKAFEGKPKELIQTLLCCARCYNARFQETASLYEAGFLLYKQALSLCKVFSPCPMHELPEPDEFSQDFLPVIDMQSLGASLPVTLEGMIPLIVCEYNDRVKALFTLVFQSASEGEKVSEFFLNTDLVRRKKAQCATASTPPDESVASTSQPKKPAVLETKKEKSLKGKAKKKQGLSVQTCTSLLKGMSLSSEASSSGSCPGFKQESQSIARQVQDVVLEAPKHCASDTSCWVSPNCLQGSGSQIMESLHFPQVSIHSHVKRQFVVKAETSPWLVACHTYPLIIARLIQRYTEPRPWFSPHRNDYDAAHSSVGTWHDYGKGDLPRLGRFTECFFAKDSPDGRAGELFHHCFYADSSSGCIARYRRNRAFDGDEDIEEILEGEKGPASPIIRPSAQFHVSFGPYSCTLDDTEEKIRYTLAFSRKIAWEHV